MIKNNKALVPSPSVCTGVLFLEDIVFSVKLGVTEEERAVPQDVNISITIEYEDDRAQISDDINDAYCYDEMLNIINDTVSSKQYKLIEHLCNDIAVAGSNTGCKSYKVRVTKRPLVLGQKISASFEISK